MTVIFAYASQKKKEVLVGGDDLESHSRLRRTKVFEAFDRFVVATVGPDVVNDAARYSAGIQDGTHLRGGETFRAPDTVETFVEGTLALLPFFVERHAARMERAVANGTRTAAQKDELYGQSGTLVVADGKTKQLWSAEIGRIFLRRNLYQATPTLHLFEQVVRFGINGSSDRGAIPPEAFEHPYRWLGTQVQEARDEVEAEGILGAIGQSGACIRMRGSKVTRWSPFASPFDFTENYNPE